MAKQTMMAKQTERRELAFDSFEEVIADMERLASGEVRTTGNHSFGQIIEHLARSLDMSTGKAPGPKLPWFMRLLMPVIRLTVLNDKPLAPGVKLPPASEAFFWPDQDFDVPTAIEHFKAAVSNYQTNGPLEKHPVFGKTTRAQNESLNYRHCALHLSFVHPA